MGVDEAVVNELLNLAKQKKHSEVKAKLAKHDRATQVCSVFLPNFGGVWC